MEENMHEKIEKSHTLGDTIGNTAYSEKFVIESLMKLLKLDSFNEKELNEFVEETLCVLWDMTVELEVTSFLISQNSFEIFCDTLNKFPEKRLTEVIIGIIGNMCSHQIIAEKINSNEYLRKSVCNCISSDDSLIIVQVLRFIDVNICGNPNSIPTWLQFFAEQEFVTNINFILNNSLNTKVLTGIFKCLKSICLYLHYEAEKKCFGDLFINETFSNAMITGYLELSKLTPEEEEFRVDFLFIASSIFSLEESSQSIFKKFKHGLIMIATKILTNSITKHSDYLTDIIQYITSLLIIFNDCEVKHVAFMCRTMFSIWCESVNRLETSSSGFDDSGVGSAESLLNILPQYFVRTLIQLSENDILDITHNVDKISLEKLKSKIIDLLKNNEIDKYFNNVPLIIDKICAHS